MAQAAIEERVAHLEGRVDGFDSRFDALERRFEEVCGRLDAHAARMDVMSNRIDALRIDIGDRLERHFQWATGISDALWGTTVVTLVGLILRH